MLHLVKCRPWTLFSFVFSFLFGTTKRSPFTPHPQHSLFRYLKSPNQNGSHSPLEYRTHNSNEVQFLKIDLDQANTWMPLFNQSEGEKKKVIQRERGLSLYVKAPPPPTPRPLTAQFFFLVFPFLRTALLKSFYALINFSLGIVDSLYLNPLQLKRWHISFN